MGYSRERLSMSTEKLATSGDALPGLFASVFEYLVDTGQRSVLFLDVMRQRAFNTVTIWPRPHLMSLTMPSI
jgi:hypothetical protein